MDATTEYLSEQCNTILDRVVGPADSDKFANCVQAYVLTKCHRLLVDQSVADRFVVVFIFLLLLCLSSVLFVAFQHISHWPQDISFRVTCKTYLTKYSRRTSKVALEGLYHMAGLGRIWKSFLTKEATQSSA